MALITRHKEKMGKGVFDVFDDGRKYAYYKGDLFSQFIVKINADDSSQIIYPHCEEWDELEEPGKDPNIELAGFHVMTPELFHSWRLVLWYDTFMWPQVAGAWQVCISGSPACSTDEQIKSLTVAFVSWYIKPTIAKTLAENLVNLGQKPKYTELGLTDAPERFIQLERGI